MRIERIDDQTIKCFLSVEELQEYHVDYKDFIYRSEKAQKLMRDIIEEAREKVGYKPPQMAFELQITMMEQGMILTFSEKDPFDLGDPSKNQNVRELLGRLKSYLQQMSGEAGGSVGAYDPNDSGPIQSLPDPGPVLPAVGGPKPEELLEVVLSFSSMANVMAYMEALPGRLRFTSELYKMEDLYYLHIAKGAASLERFRKACIVGTEYAGFCAAGEGCDQLLKEHGELLIAERAMQKLS
ncbi:MAG: adaptor protein MecA [Lachnospiraceae bacterium]|nr:adaptor protein MecA [Lachnospiraceae bacterium]